MISDEPRSGVQRETQWETSDRFAFGDHPALADELLDLVLRGLKTAAYIADVPQPGPSFTLVFLTIE